VGNCRNETGMASCTGSHHIRHAGMLVWICWDTSRFKDSHQPMPAYST
jgi:hypothetical protein